MKQFFILVAIFLSNIEMAYAQGNSQYSECVGTWSAIGYPDLAATQCQPAPYLDQGTFNAWMQCVTADASNTNYGPSPFACFRGIDPLYGAPIWMLMGGAEKRSPQEKMK